MIGLGNHGHRLPTIAADEVADFNRRELLRAAGISAPLSTSTTSEYLSCQWTSQWVGSTVLIPANDCR